MLNDYRKSESEFGPIDTDFFNTIAPVAADRRPFVVRQELAKSGQSRDFGERLLWSEFRTLTSKPALASMETFVGVHSTGSKSFLA